MNRYKITLKILLLILVTGCFSSLVAQSAKTTDKHPNMIWVEGGSFQMGNKGGYPFEKPIHTVTVDGFFISKYEITNAQYAKFLNEYGSDVVKEDSYKGQPMVKTHQWGMYKDNNTWKAQKKYENYPAINVTWFGAWAYCKFYGVRLPTEAEWEFAARGGKKGKEYKYAGGSDLIEAGWFDKNSGYMPHQVGTRLANELGLYDMSGNVCEWCADWYGSYQGNPARNPQGPSKGKNRIIRGGSWNDIAEHCQVGNRFSYTPDILTHFIGFRVVYIP